MPTYFYKETSEEREQRVAELAKEANLKVHLTPGQVETLRKIMGIEEKRQWFRWL